MTTGTLGQPGIQEIELGQVAAGMESTECCGEPSVHAVPVLGSVCFVAAALCLHPAVTIKQNRQPDPADTGYAAHRSRGPGGL